MMGTCQVRDANMGCYLSFCSLAVSSIRIVIYTRSHRD